MNGLLCAPSTRVMGSAVLHVDGDFEGGILEFDAVSGRADCEAARLAALQDFKLVFVDGWLDEIRWISDTRVEVPLVPMWCQVTHGENDGVDAIDQHGYG